MSWKVNKNTIISIMLAMAPLFSLSGKEVQGGEIESIKIDQKLLDNVKVKNSELKLLDVGLSISVPAGKSGEVVIPGKRDFTKWVYLTFDLQYQGTDEMRLDIHIKGKKRKLWKGGGDFDQKHSGFFMNKEHRIFNCLLVRQFNNMDDYPFRKDFPGMDTAPNGLKFFHNGIDAKDVREIVLRFPADNDTPKREILLKSIYLNRPVKHPLYVNKPEEFFPFIDKYGQFKHSDWKGKVKDDSDFQKSIIEEDKYMAKFPKSSQWSKYGGDLNGPKLKATGRFRVEKYKGRWVFVDPEGYLFWSLGVNFVGNSLSSTEVGERSKFFEGLPSPNSKLGQFFGKNNTIYSHGPANLYRKYKTKSFDPYKQRCVKRLKSWGFNTLGGWSFDGIYAYPEKDKIPYTLFFDVTWEFPKPLINDKLQDIYNPKWKNKLEREFKTRSPKFKDDPWLLGVFVNNELHWENPTKLAKQLLGLDGNIHGKVEYVKFLRKKFTDIGAFNDKVGTSFESWEVLEKKSFKGDVNLNAIEAINIEYYKKMCEDYFSTIRKMIDTYLPGAMYFGCRWHGGGNANEYNVPIGAKYIDVFSFNIYDNDVSKYTYPDIKKLDKPFLITEFHFGSLDRGVFSPGLHVASDQRNRGERYRIYVESAIRRKDCVGAQWFMMADEATAGFNQNENYNCGFLSVADQPYYDFIDKVRQLNYRIYDLLLPVEK